MQSAPDRYARINNLTGWTVGIIACVVYILTMEATGSFWDCGEFIASCDKLQVPHPPGAPLFIMMGRFFIILFGDSPHTAARAVNTLSALASGLSILFLFWSITHFARKIVLGSSPTAHSAPATSGSTPATANSGAAQPTGNQLFTIMSAGVIGALAYTFCDSFWYSAVEGEVYATSAFFTAIVFWAMLKWEQQADRPGSDKWIVLIFFLMGLSIGVHLLNLLTIPALTLIYYFKRYKPTILRTLLALVIGCALTGIVQVFVIQYTIKGAGLFDLFFVNSLGTPFFVGFGVFFALLAALLTIGIRWTTRRKFYYGRLACWCAAFMLLGYSTYFTTLIRSNADPGVDMFNVDNPIALERYLNRQQYGDWPILYGPDFTDPAPSVEKGDLYTKGDHKYVVAGKVYAQDWANTPSSHFFPRMWNSDNTRSEVTTYKKFSGMDEGDQPTMANNIKYFLSYQAGWMYWRYFMWNFAGKQNDLQGFGNPRDSNWISGIPVVDHWLYGNQNYLPDSIHKNNKSYNRLFMLPLILGLIGLAVQYRRNRKDALITGMLFFMTGLAIVLYLNQAGLQPRERDYAFAGSFYVFAMWIGLGVIGVQNILQRLLDRSALTSGTALTSDAARTSGAASPTASTGTSTGPAVLRRPLAAYAAAGLCLLAVPILMASQEWDDHDRSKKTLARDLAADYLESCPPNAILFSSEDNDTYPLWYAQEVEGIRPDVRIAITTLTGADWYINQLRYKINNSAPFDVLFTPEQIMGDKKEIVYFSDHIPGGENQYPAYDKNKYYDLYDTFRTVLANDDPRYTVQSEGGMSFNVLPAKKFSVPVDPQAARATGALHAGETPVSELHLDIAGNKPYLVKNDLTMLAIIAANRWKRPICFTSNRGLADLGLEKYTRSRGLTYQLVPVADSRVDNDVAYHTVMEKFRYGNAATPGVYFDEENRRRLGIIKFAHIELAESLLAVGRKEEARKVLEQYDRNVNIGNYPYGMTTNLGNVDDRYSTFFLEACYAAGDAALTAKVSASLKKDLRQQMEYYRSLGDPMTDEQLAINAQLLLQGKGGSLTDRQLPFASDIVSSYQMLLQIDEMERRYSQPPVAPRARL